MIEPTAAMNARRFPPRRGLIAANVVKVAAPKRVTV
jgi:hypothetical protein